MWRFILQKAESKKLTFLLNLLLPSHRASKKSQARPRLNLLIMADPVLFDSQFTVNAIDPDGKKFERGGLDLCIRASL